jgi:transaldolase/glucose-6-phosphate isomerase
LRGLIGKVAIANAKLTYRRHLQLFSSLRWQSLAANNAQTQRVLWASTSTKNPAYRDVIYVEELIGPDTVNTIPPATYDAFRDHGQLRMSLTEDVEGALSIIEALAEMGISMDEVTGKLLEDGLLLFSEAFDKLLNAVDRSCKKVLPARINRQTYVLPTNIDAAVKVSLKEWASNGKVRRLWARDASLWTGTDEGNWLGWLGITDDQLAHAQRFRSLAEEVKNAGFSHVLLLGMGGSSLCPDVLKMTFAPINGYPELHVLDSTDPAQIETIASRVDLKNTLFIVSSKSGNTLEPNIFKQYFFERVKQEIGRDEACTRFIAITDPGSQMQRAAENDRFRHIFFGLPSIGGRYSALSDFGLIPAAAMGLDVSQFLDRTEEMVHACTACVPAEQNPGMVLGTILGVLAKNGHDKVTIVASPGLRGLGAWLEQLLAESTGKAGKGLIPVDREPLGAVDVYGDDRVFVYVRLESGPDHAQDRAVDALEHAGHAVVRISVADAYDLGQEFFRWEIATAVAGSIVGINPFNQPDVEASKIAAKELTSAYERTGTLPVETPLLEEEGIKLFTDGMNAGVLKNTVGHDQSIAGYLKAHLNRITRHDYFGMLAYIEMNAQHEEQLQVIRHLVLDKKHAATVLGFGPRFLHSTGQAYKGGPNSGVFLQITCDDGADIPLPFQKYTFGIVKAAQARGDFKVLADRGRRVLRVHFGKDVMTGLHKLRQLVEHALSTLNQN